MPRTGFEWNKGFGTARGRDLGRISLIPFRNGRRRKRSQTKRKTVWVRRRRFVHLVFVMASQPNLLNEVPLLRAFSGVRLHNLRSGVHERSQLHHATLRELQTTM